MNLKPGKVYWFFQVTHQPLRRTRHQPPSQHVGINTWTTKYIYFLPMRGISVSAPTYSIKTHLVRYSSNLGTDTTTENYEQRLIWNHTGWPHLRRYLIPADMGNTPLYFYVIIGTRWITALGKLFLVEPHDMVTSFLHRRIATKMYPNSTAPLTLRLVVTIHIRRDVRVASYISLHYSCSRW